jgi:parallel beta-helix repeat protein
VGSPLWLTNCTISGNTATQYGGGISLSASASVYIDSCTICSNSAPEAGGILNNVGVGFASIRNSIVAGNTGSPGPDCKGALHSLDYNLIQNTNGCTVANSTTHNIYNQDPKLGPLADLGGPTPTHALRFDSPALDAGNSSGLATDQRGLPRPIDSPDIANAGGGDGSDIGAYEADPNLRMNGIQKIGPDIRLFYSSMLGRTYRLESAEDLTGTWSVLTNDVSGTGRLLQAVDAGGATLPRRFYRAVLLP